MRILAKKMYFVEVRINLFKYLTNKFVKIWMDFKNFLRKIPRKYPSRFERKQRKSHR